MSCPDSEPQFHYRYVESDENDMLTVKVNKFHLFNVIVPGDIGSIKKFMLDSGLEKVDCNERIMELLSKEQNRLKNQILKLKKGGPRGRLKESWKNWTVSYNMELYPHEAALSIKSSTDESGAAKKRKSFSELSDVHKRRVKRYLKEEIQHFIQPEFDRYELTATSVNLVGINNEEIVVRLNPTPPDENVEKDVNINQVSLIKDKFRISDSAYKELSALSDDLPRFTKILKERKDMDSSFNIFPTPGTAEGVQISFSASIRERVSILVSKNPELQSPIKVKFSGDGTWMGKRLHVVNFTYTILNEGRRAMSERGNYCLAIVKVKEVYDELRDSLADIVREMKELNSIDVDGKTFQLEYFLGGDWKFLACVCGIGAATADYACIWCKCPKNARGDRSLKWSMLDPDLGARSVEDIENCVKRKNFSVKHPPLFNFIPMHNVIIDNLHLFLRISDVLIARLITDLKVLDSIGKKITFPKGFDRQLYGHLASYETFLKDDLKLSFEVRVNKDTKKLEFRTLTGPEKLKLFRNIDIRKLIPSNSKLHYDGDRIQNLWDLFFKIICCVKSDSFTEAEADSLKNDIWSWYNLFLDTYLSVDCTPYIHALVFHVSEFISLHSNINFFNQQGLEKFNDVSTKHFFGGTNMKGVDGLKQLFAKRSRIQLLEDQGCDRQRRSIHCYNCDMTDHNILRCTAPCKNCSEPICSNHLVNIASVYTRTCVLSDDNL